MHVDTGPEHFAELLLGASDLADPREEHEHVAVVFTERLDDGGDHGGFDPVRRTSRARPLAPTATLLHRSGGAREPLHLDVERAALAGDDRGIEHPDQPGGVGGGRHGHDAEVGANRLHDVEGQREADVGRQVPLVHLVEDDGADTRQFRVALQATGQDPLGDDFDPRVGPDVAFVPGLVADQPTDACAREGRHPLRCGPRGEPSGLEHDDLSVAQPVGVEQGDRHDGRLAGSRRCDEDGALSVSERVLEIVEGVEDGQVGERTPIR